MKTIIMNGCSFVAGDEIVWEQYHKINNKPMTDWWNYPDDPEVEKFRLKYVTEYRRLNNLPITIGRNLGCNRIDLSADGNSNENIAIDTIAYILTIPPEERKNYHVVIGWTTLCRYTRYSKVTSAFFNLNVGHVMKKHNNPVTEELQAFIHGSMALGYNQDFFFNYVQNILLLENFLKNNNMSYTFFKSLGTPEDMKYCEIGPFTEGRFIPKELVTDHKCWMKISDNKDPMDSEYFPYTGHSWTSAIIKENGWMLVSNKNGHPNFQAMKSFAQMVSDFIKQQNVL